MLFRFKYFWALENLIFARHSGSTNQAQSTRCSSISHILIINSIKITRGDIISYRVDLIYGCYFKLPAIAALNDDGKATITVLLNANNQSVVQGALWIIVSINVTIMNEVMYNMKTLFNKSNQ